MDVLPSFYACTFFQTKWAVSWRRGLNAIEPFPKQALVFMCLQYKAFRNTLGKGEIAHNPFGELSAIFIKSEMSSADFFSLEASKICLLGKG